MNTSSIGNKPNVPQVENNTREPRDVKEAPAQQSNELAKITDTASLSSILPRLQNLIAAIDQPGGNVLESISDNIMRLQDGFVDTLYGAASSHGIDFTEKVTLRLNEKDQLTVLGEHPEKARIEQLLSERPELSTAFQELSTQSELLKDVNNIGKLIGSKSGISSYQNSFNRHVPASYQLSLKGEMSHFYFAK